MTENRRKHERRKVRVPIVFWETRNDERIGPGEKAVSRDLSVNGVSFETHRTFPIHSILGAQLYIPGTKTPVTTQLRVTRIQSTVASDRFLIGLDFTTMSPEDRGAIAACLKRTNLYTILAHTQQAGASDLHLTVGRPPIVRVRGRLRGLRFDPLEESHIKAMLYPLLRETQIETLETKKELDFAFSPTVDTRYRVNMHFQRGFVEAALRNIPCSMASFDQLGLPELSLQDVCGKKSGLFLIAGSTGSGKTTTMTAMVDYMNQNMERLIIAIEDPIEFVHASKRSLVKQRELSSDTHSYAEALRRSLRQDPDVIVVGELLDTDCVLAAMRAAETGHLVISTVHAPDSEQAIERLVNLFPPEHHASVCQQLASCLEGILFQMLVPSKRGDRVLATELLVVNYAIRNMIRERRFTQIGMSIQTGRKHGMHTLESSLERLQQASKIDVPVVKPTEPAKS